MTKQAGKLEVFVVANEGMGLQCNGPRITKIILSNSILGLNMVGNV